MWGGNEGDKGGKKGVGGCEAAALRGKKTACIEERVPCRIKDRNKASKNRRRPPQEKKERLRAAGTRAATMGGVPASCNGDPQEGPSRAYVLSVCVGWYQATLYAGVAARRESLQGQGRWQGGACHTQA